MEWLPAASVASVMVATPHLFKGRTSDLTLLNTKEIILQHAAFPAPFHRVPQGIRVFAGLRDEQFIDRKYHQGGGHAELGPFVTSSGCWLKSFGRQTLYQCEASTYAELIGTLILHYGCYRTKTRCEARTYAELTGYSIDNYLRPASAALRFASWSILH